MKNIILISIDNLRYDCIGYQPDKRELKKYDALKYLETPTLDSLAEKSICFTQCISTNTYTTAAHASVFTGLFPPRHGVRAHYETKLSKDVFTLTEVLKVFGYKTVFSTDVIELFEPLDLIRGFDHIFFLDDHNLLKFLKENENEKIFLFMHMFDEPYLLTEFEYKKGRNLDYFDKMKELYHLFSIPFAFDYDKDKHRMWGHFWKNVGRIDVEYAFPLFVKGVTKFDKGRFRWIVEQLKKTILKEDSLLAVFSDHGEGRISLNNPSFFSHAGDLFENVIRVPLMISHPDLGHGIKNNLSSIVDKLVINPEKQFFVIPVKTGIQSFQVVTCFLDTRFRGYDDFLRVCHC